MPTSGDGPGRLKHSGAIDSLEDLESAQTDVDERIRPDRRPLDASRTQGGEPAQGGRKKHEASANARARKRDIAIIVVRLQTKI